MDTIIKPIQPSGAECVGDYLLDRRALAEVIGMSPEAISVDLCRGKFPIQPLRIGRRLRWRASDVRRFIEEGR